jgi:acetoin utilization protein AcuB
MQVAARMTRRPVVTSPDATLRQVCNLMTKNGVRHLPVLKEGDLVGIITDRDILSVTSHATGMVADLDRPVGDYMTTSVITVSPETYLEDAVQLIRKHHIAALPVMSGSRLVGIITEGDVLAALLELASRHTRRVRLELTIPRSPEHFQRLCQIATDHGARLHRAERHPRTQDKRIDVVLEVSSPVVERLLDAIGDAGFEIDLIVYAG